MPGAYDDFEIHIDCPECGQELTERYGRLRTDPRTMCLCGAHFAVCLAGSPVEVADRLWDLRSSTMVANDNDLGLVFRGQ